MLSPLLMSVSCWGWGSGLGCCALDLASVFRRTSSENKSPWPLAQPRGGGLAQGKVSLGAKSPASSQTDVSPTQSPRYLAAGRP